MPRGCIGIVKFRELVIEMSDRIELSKSRARKLVKFWEGHINNNTETSNCPNERCPIHKYFMELKKKSRNAEVPPQEKG